MMQGSAEHEHEEEPGSQEGALQAEEENLQDILDEDNSTEIVFEDELEPEVEEEAPEGGEAVEPSLFSGIEEEPAEESISSDNSMYVEEPAADESSL